MISKINLQQLEADTEELNKTIKEELTPEQQKKGRRAGTKQTKYKYKVELYDPISKHFMIVDEFKTLTDIFEVLNNKYNLQITLNQIKYIYNGSFNPFIKILNL